MNNNSDDNLYETAFNTIKEIPIDVIQYSDDVCSGFARMRGTRVTVTQIITLFGLGYSIGDVCGELYLSNSDVQKALLHVSKLFETPLPK